MKGLNFYSQGILALWYNTILYCSNMQHLLRIFFRMRIFANFYLLLVSKMHLKHILKNRSVMLVTCQTSFQNLVVHSDSSDSFHLTSSDEERENPQLKKNKIKKPAEESISSSDVTISSSSNVTSSSSHKVVEKIIKLANFTFKN